MPQSPQIADTAPDEPFLMGYDMAHLVTYLRLLDADAEGVDRREVAAIVLELDVAKDPKRDGQVPRWPCPQFSTRSHSILRCEQLRDLLGVAVVTNLLGCGRAGPSIARE